MSRCVHAQSEYKLHQLPRCSKCKVEMQLVLVQYDNKPKPVWEWECRKCPKAVAKHKLQEAPPSAFEQFLTERCENDLKEAIKRRESNKAALQDIKPAKSDE